MTIQERIIYFNFIRDIPYYIAVEEGETDFCCASKPMMLKVLLESLGLKVRRILADVKWSSWIPKHIMKLPHDKDTDNHEFLEVYIPEKKKWVKVDPTWDSRQKAFPVPKWDGLSDTILCVKPDKIYSPEESKKMLETEDDPAARKLYLEHHKEFFKAFNSWLQSQRTY